MINNWVEGIDYPVWMTEESLKTLNRQHLSEGESPKAMYIRIVNTLCDRFESMLKDKMSLHDRQNFIANIHEKWLEYLWNGWLCPSTPILSNCGTKRGLTISCFINRVPDSLTGIYQTLHETAMLTKYGGGVGITFDKVRGRGEVISGGGFSEGTIPFIKVYDSAIVATSQGSSRRGAISINLPIRHKDIREFLKIRLPIGDVNRQSLNVNHCVTIDDFFYEDLLNGEQSSREIWSELLSSRMKTGQPYIFNYHTVNNNRPEDWKKRNMKIDGTNLCCLAGDTKVFTREGIFKIKDLVGWEVTVFDGENWVKCNNFKSYGFDDIYKLTLENGSQIECNSGHRHVLDDGSIKTTFELSFGDRIKIKTLKLNEFIDDWSQYCTFERLHDKQEVFCPTIPTTGKFLLANGVLTGNSEIMGVHDFDNTVVCDLASLNLSKWDEWKDDPEFIENCLLFLDVNLEEFIEKAKDINGFEKAVNFASRSRMLGLGVLGWHTLLQSKNLPFNSIPSQGLIRKIAGKMKTDGNVYNKKWGKILGNPEWCDENRNIALFAIAPTTTNSLVSGGVSQGIEPLICNAWVQKSAKGTFIRKNKFFETLMETKYPDKNTEQFWNALMSDYKGSVQELDFLTESEKEVLLTAYEINQLELVKCAAIWQQYIDQGISLNLFFPADVDPKWLNKVHLTAWEEGVKTLYYVRTESILSRNMKGSTFSDCLYCEG